MTFEFIADRPALDFVATVAERGTSDLEALTRPADLDRWIRESGLLDDRPLADDADLARARQLRDALFALIAAAIDGTSLPTAARTLVNSAAARARPRPELDVRGRVRRHGDLDAVLADLASDTLDLLGGPDRELLSWCADGRCTRPFVDRSRGQRRRWCGMAGCGDRAKAAAYRARLRDADG